MKAASKGRAKDERRREEMREEQARLERKILQDSMAANAAAASLEAELQDAMRSDKVMTMLKLILVCHEKCLQPMHLADAMVCMVTQRMCLLGVFCHIRRRRDSW